MSNKILKFADFKNGNPLQEPKKHALTTKGEPKPKKEKSLETILIDYKINVKIGKYKPDYVNESNKHIIEVYGDYWHCNPKLFNKDFYHPQLKKTAEEKWLLDLVRQQYFESLRYTVEIIWEDELNDYRNRYSK